MDKAFWGLNDPTVHIIAVCHTHSPCTAAFKMYTFCILDIIEAVIRCFSHINIFSQPNGNDVIHWNFVKCDNRHSFANDDKICMYRYAFLVVCCTL